MEEEAPAEESPDEAAAETEGSENGARQMNAMNGFASIPKVSLFPLLLYLFRPRKRGSRMT